MIAIPNMDKPKDSCWNCKAQYNSVCSLKREYVRFDGILDDCPLIDIVTCGECKHWYNDADCGMACEFTNMEQPSDGFCNWGERRSE